MRVRALVTAVVATTIVCVVAAGVAEGAGTPRPRVTLIGDSVAASLLLVPEARALLGRGVDLVVDAKVCRRLVGTSCPYRGNRPSNALDAILEARQLGEVVVIDVGYNDDPAGYAEGIDQVMRALVARGARTVIWSTLKGDRPGYREINAAIRAETRQWEQMQVVDWDRYSGSHAAWFVADGLHVNAAGALGLARMLRPHIALATCVRGCPHGARSA